MSVVGACCRRKDPKDAKTLIPVSKKRVTVIKEKQDKIILCTGTGRRISEKQEQQESFRISLWPTFCTYAALINVLRYRNAVLY